MDGLNWASIIPIAAGSGVIAAGVNQCFQWYRDRSKAKGEALYCAVKLIVKLEHFAIECATNVEHHHAMFLESGYREHNPICPVPSMVWDDEDLSALSPIVSSKIVWFSTEVKLARQQIVQNSIDDPDPEVYSLSYINLVGYLGYKSIGMADNLRRVYKLPPLVSDWSLFDKKVYLESFWVKAKTSLR